MAQIGSSASGFSYAPTAAPKTTTPTNSWRAFATGVLHGLGAPVTATNLNVMVAWMAQENTKARFNPLATTMGWNNAGRFNSVGVRNYSSWSDGVRATVATLRLGYYREVVAALRQGDNGYAVASAIGASPWAGGTAATRAAYGNRIWNLVSSGHASSLYGTPLGTTANVPSSGGSGASNGTAAGPGAGLDAALRAFIPSGYNLDKYVNDALAQGLEGQDAVDFALNSFLRAPEGQRAYPGIFRADGTRIMSPGQYLQTREALKTVAQQFDLTIDNNTAGHLINLEVSPQEFAQTRAPALQILNNNPALRQFLAGTLHLDTAQKQRDFVLGRSTQEFYNRYEEAYIASQSKTEGANVSATQALAIAKQTPGLDLEQLKKGLSTTGDQLRFARPELRGFGASDAAIVAYNLGTATPSQRHEVEQALKQRQAALEANPVQPRTATTPQGRPIVGGSQAPGL